jgi:hypothetical protein
LAGIGNWSYDLPISGQAREWVMTEDHAPAGSENASEPPHPGGTNVEGAQASQTRNRMSEREWRGDWQITVGIVVVIVVLLNVLFLLTRGR